MYRIGICTEKEEAARLEAAFSHLEGEDGIKLQISTWQSMEELTEVIRVGRDFDVLFLRTSEGDRRAIALGKLLREEQRNFHVQLIYLADTECYSRELIQTIPLDFFIEKSGKETAEEILRRAIGVIKKSKERFEFRFGKNYYSIPLRDIIYVCSDVRRIRVKTAMKEFEFNGLLRDVKELLPKDFLVIHKSFIVNKEHVLHYTYETVSMSDGTILSVSKINRSRVKACLMAGR